MFCLHLHFVSMATILLRCNLCGGNLDVIVIAQYISEVLFFNKLSKGKMPLIQIEMMLSVHIAHVNALISINVIKSWYI